MEFDQTISQLVLFFAVIGGIVTASLWIGMTVWTWRDIRARSRDVLAQTASTVLVAVLSVFGLLIYLMLRPRETIAEAYERSLEEEALLQGIEEKPVCPGCGRPSNAQWQVCPYCYTRLKKPCIKCSQLLELSWALCPYCATQQPTEGGRAAAPSAAAGNRGRRPVTAVRNAGRSAPAASDEQENALEFVEGDEA